MLTVAFARPGICRGKFLPAIGPLPRPYPPAISP
jgi:hypothetical protein